MRGRLLVAGATSDAGRSLVTTGLCRALARRGLRVAPFKAQNMSNNSMVTWEGAEIGRAQWIQAVAAGAEPEAAMNPVLLKPASDHGSHVVVMGQPAGRLDAGEFVAGRITCGRRRSRRSMTCPAGTTSWFARVREERLDRLGDLVEEHLDMEAICRLVADGPPPELPIVTSGLR